MGFLSRVGGSPKVGNTPTKGLLGDISREDLKLAGRIVNDENIDDLEISAPAKEIPRDDQSAADTRIENAPTTTAEQADQAAINQWLDGETIVETQAPKPPGVTIEAQLSEPEQPWGDLEDIAAKDDGHSASRLKLARRVGNPRRGDRDDRDAQRIPASLRVEYRNAGRVEVELAADISVSGAFVRTSSPLDVGDPILLTFDLPDQRFPLQIAARVKWVTPFGDARSARPGMGVQFSAISERKRSQLESLIRNSLEN